MRKGVLITGGAKRIGAALAKHFVHAGYDVALHCHHSDAEANKLKTEIEKLDQACDIFCHDLTDIAGIPAFMGRVQEAMPYCSALINNASVFDRADFLATGEALFDRQFAINLKAPFFLTQAFACQFTTGSVVNLLDSEIAGTNGSHFAYLLSKKALTDFTLMAARALGPGIRVNAVCPGIVLPNNDTDAAYQQKLAETLPLRQTGNVRQVCDAALWLCNSAGLTGQILYTDGGQHLL